MKLQRLMGLGCGVVLCAALCPRTQAEDGRISGDTLSAMGLGGMTVMSDDEALAVRGHGYKPHTTSSVSVYGNSIASIEGKNGGATSENGYLVSGSHYAAGGNNSYAGKATISTGGSKPGGGYGGMPGGGYPGGGAPGGHPGSVTIKATVFFAGGSSWGKAF